MTARTHAQSGDTNAIVEQLFYAPGAPGIEVFRQTVTLVEGEAEMVATPALMAGPVRATVRTGRF
jgi:hypothetical protein